MLDQKEDINLQSSNIKNNKRIAKNTLFLYIRNIITLVIGLYTSREVLAQLGISDFGIYNVVGGVIVLFSFIQGAMNSATSRYFTFDLGKGDFEALKKTFCLSVIIHIFTALLILILGETVGLWFMNTKLVIPEARMGAANFVYQFSVFSACIGILQVPYTVAINAHERMKIIAYFGIAEVVLKLAIVLSLAFTSYDKLKIYSILLFFIYIILFLSYQIYCLIYFKETHFKWYWDKKMFKERIGFGGWTMLQGTSTIAALQGVNMLLNMFYGVIANAAYGIMTQVSNAMNQFANNFLSAVNPQITKSYAKNDMDYFYSLLFRSIKFSFFISFVLGIPLVINMDFILHLWLKTVPEYAVIFCQIRIIDWVMWMFVCLLLTAINSTGKIKMFMIIDSIFILLNFILSYIFLSQKYSPVSVPIIYISVNVFRCVLYILFSKILYNLSIKLYLQKVLFKTLTVTLISVPLPIIISFYTKGWTALILTTGSFIIPFLISVILFGLDRNERTTIFNYIKEKVQFEKQ
jgi:O-antigen/teichoic acid export membrane protein